MNNGDIGCTIVLNTGSYECTDMTDTDTDNDAESSISSTNSAPTLFSLEGSNVAYYNLDDAPLESLIKLKLARHFYLECKSVCNDLQQYYDLCPRKIALQLDDRTRMLHHSRSKDSCYGKEFFFDEIMRTTFPFLKNKPIKLPYFVVTGWYDKLHQQFIVHPHFHRTNIKLACALEEFIARNHQKRNQITRDGLYYSASRGEDDALDIYADAVGTEDDVHTDTAADAAVPRYLRLSNWEII